MNLIEKNDAMWWIKVVGGSVIATIGTYLVWRKSGKRKSREEYPKDTVILHQYGRAPYAPSMSPFAIKLETYLRMAKIPYMVCLIDVQYIIKDIYNSIRTYARIKYENELLGEKKFLLGERPCEEDCAIFGQLAEWYWLSFGHRSEPVIKNYKNLCDYCERMKETFWPDWDECNSNGTKKEATK
ncbi:failed axon connections homolog [Mytilus californianus]|uniref:failed axon connections homolog n=1 Tax=Mytilus californianus TaxID=6549 RepID=UPI0022461690|nr:failed axon connections homolog [Mytilus californianus]